MHTHITKPIHKHNMHTCGHTGINIHILTCTHIQTQYRHMYTCISTHTYVHAHMNHYLPPQLPGATLGTSYQDLGSAGDKHPINVLPGQQDFPKPHLWPRSWVAQGYRTVSPPLGRACGQGADSVQGCHALWTGSCGLSLKSAHGYPDRWPRTHCCASSVRQEGDWDLIRTQDLNPGLRHPGCPVLVTV